MPSNVEIKARAEDLHRIRKVAEALTDTPPQLISQEDTFFQVQSGRLKLRIFTEGHGELIYYQRRDSAGPRESRYAIAPVPSPEAIASLLGGALGIVGTVRKQRTLFLIGQTRLHLDDVEGLGQFVELEVVLKDGQPISNGVAIAEDLMSRLGIQPQDLVTAAYLDLLYSRAANAADVTR